MTPVHDEYHIPVQHVREDLLDYDVFLMPDVVIRTLKAWSAETEQSV